MKTIVRTLVYQCVLLFAGGSLGFILNAEYIGWKSAIIERSFYNIFYPVEYSPDVERVVLEYGRMRLNTALNGHPLNNANITVMDEFVWNEEVYVAKYRWICENGECRLGEYSTRVRWKSWEYYYEYHGPDGTPREVFTPELPDPDDTITAEQPPAPPHHP